MPKLRSKRALTPADKKFAEICAALEEPPGKGEVKAAFERCFPERVQEIKLTLANKKTRLGSRISTEASQKLRSPLIQAYVLELRGMDAETAKRVLLEDAILNDNAKSAEKVIEQEDRLKFRDAVEAWAELLCAVGTEVVVPLGENEVSFPLSEMFPKFRGATPPPDAIRKTMRSLDEHLYKSEHPDDLRLEQYEREGFHGFRGGNSG